MIHEIDRRASPRYSTADNQTYVRLIARFGTRISKARLINISHHGALILTDDVVASHQPLEVRLDDAPEIGWIKAEAVRYGQRQGVGIRFDRFCDRHVLVAAIRGFDNEWRRQSEEETTEIVKTDLARGVPITPSVP